MQIHGQNKTRLFQILLHIFQIYFNINVKLHKILQAVAFVSFLVVKYRLTDNTMRA